MLWPYNEGRVKNMRRYSKPVLLAMLLAAGTACTSARHSAAVFRLPEDWEIAGGQAASPR